MKKRLSEEAKEEIERMLEDAIAGYRDHLQPDAVAHMQADFAQMLDYFTWEEETHIVCDGCELERS